MGAEVSAGVADSGAGWIGGTGRRVNGGGGGAVKGGDTGTFTGSTSAPSIWTPSSRLSFSSDFQSSSEGNEVDCDQLDIPTHARYKFGA